MYVRMKMEFGLDVRAGGGGLRSFVVKCCYYYIRYCWAHGWTTFVFPALGGLNTQQPLTGGRCRTSHIIPHRQLTSLAVTYA